MSDERLERGLYIGLSRECDGSVDATLVAALDCSGVPAALQDSFRPFHDMATFLLYSVPRSPARTAALMRLHDAKVAVLEAYLARPVTVAS